MAEITSEEQNKVKRMKRTADSLRDLWDNIKHPTTHRTVQLAINAIVLFQVTALLHSGSSFPLLNDECFHERKWA